MLLIQQFQSGDNVLEVFQSDQEWFVTDKSVGWSKEHYAHRKLIDTATLRKAIFDIIANHPEFPLIRNFACDTEAKINEAIAVLTKMNPDVTNGIYPHNAVAIVRTDENGRTGWSFEQPGVKAGHIVVLADGRTKAIVRWASDRPESIIIKALTGGGVL